MRSLFWNTILIFLNCAKVNSKSISLQYTTAATADQVVSLPNSNSPLKSRQFSGFLDIGKNKYIHYYYIEAEVSGFNSDINSILKKPLVFWTNGGPGTIL